jgi:hypothetical protein
MSVWRHVVIPCVDEGLRADPDLEHCRAQHVTSVVRFNLQLIVDFRYLEERTELLKYLGAWSNLVIFCYHSVGF